MSFRYFITNMMIIGLAAAFLVHFALITKYKQVLIQEPNLTILVLEIGLLVACIIFAGYNIRKGQ